MDATDTLTLDQIDTVARVEDDLVTGRTFRLIEASARSSYGYRPPVNRQGWAHAIETLGRMAAQSDPLAAVARRAVAHVNLYGTAPQVHAGLAGAFAQAVADGYDDVIGRSAPDAGRRRDHHRAFTLHECVALAVWLEEASRFVTDRTFGVGWVVSHLARREGVALSVTR